MAYLGYEPSKVAVTVGQGVIDASHIEDASITTADLSNDAVTATKIDDDGTGFQMGSLGLGTAVSGSHKLTVGGTATFSGDITGTLATAAQTNITSVGTLSSLTLGGDLTLPQKIIHSGDTDTYLSFGTDSLSLYTGGTNVIDFIYGNIYIKQNNKAVVGYNSGGSAKELIKIDGSDVVQLGEGLDLSFAGKVLSNVKVFNTGPGLQLIDSNANERYGEIYYGTRAFVFSNILNDGSGGTEALSTPEPYFDFRFATGVSGTYSTALKLDYDLSATFSGDVTVDGDKYMLSESGTNKGFFGKDDWATSGGSADNVNVGSYPGQVKITAGAATNSTSNIVCLTDKSTHFNNYINVEGDVQHKVSSGSGVTVYKTVQKTGTYSGDVEIVCSASGWKSFIYDLSVVAHMGGGHWRGQGYHNSGITHHYQSVADNNGGVSAMSLSSSGQSMTFTVPINSITHVLVEFRLSTGGGDLITQDDITITID